MVVELKFDVSDIRHAVTRMRPEVRNQMADGLDHAGRKFLKTFRSERLSGPPGVRGSSMRGLFGTFKRIFSSPSSAKGMGTIIFSRSNIAALHEFGGVVQPQEGSLAIPLSARTQLFAKSGKLRAKYKRLSSLKNIVPINFGGKVFLTRVNRRTNEVTPLFVLKPSVKLKPRLEFYETFDVMQPLLFQLLAKSLAKGIRDAWDKN